MRSVLTHSKLMISGTKMQCRKVRGILRYLQKILPITSLIKNLIKNQDPHCQIENDETPGAEYPKDD